MNLTKRYVSDIVWKAQDDAGVKAFNSFSFRDIVDILSAKWTDVYNKLNQIDEGFYSVTTKLTSNMTTLPPYVKNTVDVYDAPSPIPEKRNRNRYKASSQSNLLDRRTYHISGFDLFCPDVERYPGLNIWVNYTPQAPELLFPIHNREPRILKPDWSSPSPYAPFADSGYAYSAAWDTMRYGDANYISCSNSTTKKAYIRKYPKTSEPNNIVADISKLIFPDNPFPYTIDYFKTVYPYVFITYRNTIDVANVQSYYSIIYKDMLNNPTWTDYNAFDFIGKPTNCMFLATDFNHVTGMGVTVADFGDQEDVNGFMRPRIKELGFCPDTLVVFPDELVSRYLTAVLAERFVAKNNATDTQRAVADELAAATYAFNNFIGKDKSSWQRIEIVARNGITAWV